MANTRDFTGKNRKFTGTKGITISKGTTGERVGSESGELRFNTTTELMEYYDGNQWKPIDAPPSITNVATSDAVGNSTILNADGSTLYTITITGGNFGVGATVKFIGNTGTEYTAGNINRISNSSITCTTLSSMGTSDDPYDVQVTNASGLSASLEDAFSYNAAPVFANASGQIGTVYNGQVISGSTLNAGSTDAEGNTITHTIISGSLPGSGLSIASSTGYITGTLSGSPSLGNYIFVVQAATTEGTVNRQFSLQVIQNPFVAATGGSVTTSGDFKIHTFTGDDNFIVTSAGTPGGSNTIDYLMVGAGGAGGPYVGGGGGAGGFRYFTSDPVSATTYPVVIGAGGSGSGTNTTFKSLTATGGGVGSNFSSSPGSPGGSGGGAGGYNGVNATGGSGNSPPVSPSQGNSGGSTPGPRGATQTCGAGGGGASGSGPNCPGPSGTGTPGGAGTQNNIDGNNYYYAGGGGGGSYNSESPIPAGPGGIGGGGGGGATGGGPVGTGGGSARNSGGNGTPGPAGGDTKGGNGGANTGGGGGGGGHYAGSPPNGGSGIVIIKYRFQ